MQGVLFIMQSSQIIVSFCHTFDELLQFRRRCVILSVCSYHEYAKEQRSVSYDGGMAHCRRGCRHAQNVTRHDQATSSREKNAWIQSRGVLAYQSRRIEGVSQQATKYSRQTIRASRKRLAHQSTVVTRQILRGFQSTRVCLHTLLPVSSIPDRCRNRQGFSLHEARVVDTRSVETSRSMLNTLILSVPYAAMAIPLFLFALRHAFPMRNGVQA